MERPQFIGSSPVQKLLAHPTPNHIAHCIEREMIITRREWEARTGNIFPYVAAHRAIQAGIDRAVREHSEGII